MESFGGKIRDTQGEFAGADFRDEKTGLMFAYDYENKFTVRVWGSTFKPALYKELKRLGVETMIGPEATALLVKQEKAANAAIGAWGGRTYGQVLVFCSGQQSLPSQGLPGSGSLIRTRWG